VRAVRPPFLAVALAVALTGCIPGDATTEGTQVNALYTQFMLAAAVVFALVYGLLAYAVVRFRRRDDALPDQVRGNVRLEVLWTAGPALLVAGLFALTLLTLNEVEQVTPTPAVRLEVTAFRWGWTIRYPDEGVDVTSGAPNQAAEFAVPVGQTVRVSLTAADVQHAFYIPAFLYKRDAYPGRVQDFDFTVEAAGTYGGQCAEFCGTYHARMPLSVQALDEAAYRAWLDERRTAGAP
jgi:cytochrome c oxidase subunit 2